MRIQHNIMAMSAYRNYTNNVSAMKKNLEKLSSGYKINRAGDDAAGLAISEKMRAQITGLETAQKNAKDGISLVQTAEGALTEVHDMLNRMVELATQSANGTYSNEVDREQLQKEVAQLQDEINRISKAANFNGIQLLNGDMDASLKMGTMQDISVTAVEDGAQTAETPQSGKYVIDLSDLKLTGTAGSTASAAGTPASLNAFTVANQKFKTASGADVSFTATALGVTKGSVTVTGTQIANLVNGKKIELDGITYDVAASNGKITLTSTEVPKDPSKLSSALDVVLTPGTGSTDNNGHDQSVHLQAKAVADTGTKLAQGKFTLTTAHVKDGTALQIGKNTYVFKVGKDSTVEAGSGQTLIDLSESTNTGDALVKEAAMLLSQKDNDQFHITVNNDGKTIHLTEKANTVKYTTDYDLAGPKATGAADATWKRVDGGKSVVQFSEMTKVNPNGKALTLQIGDTNDDFNQLKVNIQACDATSIGVGDVDISTQAGAADAIKKIKDAINYVSNVRGTLGAAQNRLDHTINNLSVMTENIQDAESTIRDVDVAEEMMAYTKNNILIQSAQAMLAQANQVPQGVLQLLQ